MLVNSEAACVVLKGGSCEPDTRTNAGFVTTAVAVRAESRLDS
jgi:hypothetical protein